MYHNAFQNVEIGEIGEKVLHPDHLGILQIYTHLAGKQNMNRPILDTVKDGVVMEWRWGYLLKIAIVEGNTKG